MSADGTTLAPLTRPARLRAGARVAVVSPSGPVPAERLDAGLDLLRGWGLDPLVMPHVLDVHRELEYLMARTRRGPGTSRTPGAIRPSTR